MSLSRQLSLPLILDLFRLRDCDVMGLYLVGSRLWGTSREESDFDLVVVVSALPKEYRSPKAFVSVHRNNFDALILSSPLFLERIRQGSLLEWVCCHLVGTEFCLVDAFATSPSVRRQSVGPELKATVCRVVERDLSMARKYFVEKQSPARGKKTLVHLYRTLTLWTTYFTNNLPLREVAYDVALSLTELRSASAQYFALQYRYEKEWAAYDAFVSGEIAAAQLALAAFL